MLPFTPDVLHLCHTALLLLLLLLLYCGLDTAAAAAAVDVMQALYDAIARHNASGILFVTAAGNAGSNNDVVADYPGGYGERQQLTDNL
jgi:hypothetical protein